MAYNTSIHIVRHTVFASVITDFGALALKLFIHCHKRTNNMQAHIEFACMTTFKCELYCIEAKWFPCARVYATRLQSFGPIDTNNTTYRTQYVLLRNQKRISYVAAQNNRSIGRTRIKLHNPNKKRQTTMRNSNCRFMKVSPLFVFSIPTNTIAMLYKHAVVLLYVSLSLSLLMSCFLFLLSVAESHFFSVFFFSS